MSAGLKGYRRQAAEDLVRYGYGELNRYFVILAAKRGYTVTDIAVQCPERIARSSKHAERPLRGALDFLTVFFLAGYGERPLHLMGGLGLWSITAGVGVFGYLGYLGAVLHQNITGRPILVVGALLLIAGVQLLVFGLLAEMINNLEHPKSAGSKIAQVLHVDRRSSFALAPGVQVDRRRDPRATAAVVQPVEYMRRDGASIGATLRVDSDFEEDAS